eukprot:GABV01000378.1.p1 GENE.GABV01000378.1~~GABV01000378.1.p1  ORF type:complete len:337 (+),score=85.25 GABV01000378.1:370-1380(+)
MNEDKEIDEVYTLLTNHYVEDDDNMFRFDYSREFLSWALKPPGFKKNWHLGVRTKAGGKLVACITAIPATAVCYQREIPSVEINFLCVHRKLRSHRLAPVLIREITRRVNRENIWQAVYTAGVVIPKPAGRTQYFHRSLNPKKLIEVGFSRRHSRMKLASTIKLYKLPEKPLIPGVRPLTEADVPAARKLLMDFLPRFDLFTKFDTDEEFAHWFLPRKEVIYSYVVEDAETKEITDFCSFYSLPSSVIKHPKHKTLNAAYSFYNVAGKHPWVDLMQDALILARNEGFDVFNALNLMENESFLKELKFGAGDGNLHYYLFNWKCPEIDHSKIGIVLL